jgi:hypothetical protein
MSLNRVQFITTNHYSQKAVNEFVASLATSDVNADKAKLKVLDYLKVNHLAAAFIFCAFFLLMPLLSNTRISFFSKTEKLLVLNFKYISSPTEYLQPSGNQQRQMQSLKPVVKRRSPIVVQVTGSSGNMLYQKEYAPRGLRQDISIFVYDEISTSDSLVNIKVTEKAFPEKALLLSNVKLNTDDGTIVSFADEQLKILTKQ